MAVNRDIRVRKASVLIKQHPTWGYRRINKSLRKEFGVGLRAEYLSGVKQRRIEGLPRVSKTVREKRAKQMIIDHPSWGKRHINKELRKELGAGLRDDTVARLKEKTLTGRPRAKTGRKSVIQLLAEELITPDLVAKTGIEEINHKLLSAGFLKMEIRHILSAGNIPQLFKTKPFILMLQERRRWWREMRRAGFTNAEIVDAIRRYYSVEGRSPFDFLRVEYKPPRKADIVKYREAARKRSERKVATLYGKAKVTDNAIISYANRHPRTSIERIAKILSVPMKRVAWLVK